MFASAYVLQSLPWCYSSWQSSEAGMRSSDKGDNKAAGTIEEFQVLFVFLTGGPYTSWRPQKHFAGVATRGHEWCSTPQYRAKLKGPMSYPLL